VIYSLVAGKKAGNFAGSAVLCKHPARKLLRIQQFASKFPTQASRESIRPSRELIRHFEPEQGIRREIDPRAAAHPISSKAISIAGRTIIN
jgi:hypothetical protein